METTITFCFFAAIMCLTVVGPQQTARAGDTPRLDVKVEHDHQGQKKDHDHYLKLDRHDKLDKSGKPGLIKWHSGKEFSIILPSNLTFTVIQGQQTSDPSLFNPGTTAMIDSTNGAVILQITNYPTTGETGYHIAVSSNKVHSQSPKVKIAPPYYYDMTEATLVWQEITIQ